PRQHPCPHIWDAEAGLSIGPDCRSVLQPASARVAGAAPFRPDGSGVPTKRWPASKKTGYAARRIAHPGCLWPNPTDPSRSSDTASGGPTIPARAGMQPSTNSAPWWRTRRNLWSTTPQPATTSRNPCSNKSSSSVHAMAKTDGPITIKKYANRRLYNTGTSTYVTLEDLATMVKAGEDFVVHDAKTGEDITRQVLAQIIFEQENKEGQSLLPIAFLRQLIRFYGDSMQMLVPRYLEVSIDSLTREQEKFREHMAQAFGGSPFGALEEQVRRNMEMFERAFAMFTPFARREGQNAAEPDKNAAQGGAGEIDDLKRQMEEMQKRLERLSDKDKA